MARPHTAHQHAPDFDPGLVLRTIATLRRVAAATNGWQRSPTEGGYTLNQALVLHHLVAHGDATPSQLADWMHVTRGTITPIIKRLEDLGLLHRHIDHTDGRKQILTATPEAHEIEDELHDELLTPLHDTFADWTGKELKRFCRDMDRLLASPLFGGST